MMRGATSHDQARSRAYRWGEDGTAGVSDDQQLLCLSLGLWNGADPILKERFFGLTNAAATTARTSRSTTFTSTAPHPFPYAHALQVPAAEYPYEDLVTTNRERSRTEFE